MTFLKIFCVESYAKLAPYFAKHRKGVAKMHKFFYFLRRLKIPFYKNVYDWLSFYSYYPVLKEVLARRPGGNYFEWGPGLNTDLAKKNMSKVFSVEHHPDWHKKYLEKYPVILSPISNDSCLNYPGEIKTVGERINIAFVDGRCRTECIKACAQAGVEITVMHDSLNPFTYEPANDSAPPADHESIYFNQGYDNYKYFVEVVDLRTIVLTNSEQLMEELKNIFSKYYLNFGLSSEYMQYYK